MDASSSLSYDANGFTSAESQDMHFSLLVRKIIEERAFNLRPNKHPDIYVVMKKNKFTYRNSQIQPVAKGMVLKFYVNAYKPPTKDALVEPEFISWVRGGQIMYDWKTVNMLLNMKFREPNCEYLLQKTTSRTG